MIGPDESVVGGSEVGRQPLVCCYQEVVTSDGQDFGVVWLADAFEWKLAEMNAYQQYNQ